jgi:LMBR1 domain-containing protein 1
MIILTDRYLLHRGKTFKWLQRSDINNIELHSMYEEHRVC